MKVVWRRTRPHRYDPPTTRARRAGRVRPDTNPEDGLDNKEEIRSVRGGGRRVDVVL
jgi:hypothetical protein